MKKFGVFFLAVLVVVVFGFTMAFADGNCGSPHHGKKGHVCPPKPKGTEINNTFKPSVKVGVGVKNEIGVKSTNIIKDSGNATAATGPVTTTVTDGDTIIEEEGDRIVIPPEFIGPQFPNFREMDYITEEKELKIISAAIGYIPPFISRELIAKNKIVRLSNNPFNWTSGIPLFKITSKAPAFDWDLREFWYEEVNNDEEIPKGLFLLKGEKNYFVTIEDLLNAGYKPVYGPEIKGAPGVDLKELVYTSFDKVLNKSRTKYVALVAVRVNSESYAAGRNTGISVMAASSGTTVGVGGLGEGSSVGGEKRQFRLFVVGCRKYEKTEDGYEVIPSPPKEEKKMEVVPEPVRKPAEVVRIEIVTPVAPLPPPPPPAPAPAPKVEALPPFVVYFPFDIPKKNSEDVYDVPKEFKPVIQKYAVWLKAHPGFTVQGEGHACTIGSREYNAALSRRRSKAVRDEFLALGIPESQIPQFVSLSEDFPTSERLPENRRVILRVIGPASGK